MCAVDRGRVAGHLGIPGRRAWRRNGDTGDARPEARRCNVVVVVVRRDGHGLIISPVSRKAPTQQVGLRRRGRYLERERGGTGVDDRAGVDGHVARLLEDLLDAGDRQGVVDHHPGEAAGIGSVSNLGRRALSGEQFDADRVDAVRLAGGIQEKAQPEVEPDLARGAQRIVAAGGRNRGDQLEPGERDAPEVVAECLRHLDWGPPQAGDEHLIEIGSHAARMLPVDHQRKSASEGAIFDLEEIGRVHGGIRITVGQVHRIGRHKADPEENGPGRGIDGSGQIDLTDLRRAGDQDLIGRKDSDAVRRECCGPGDAHDRGRRGGEVGLEHGTCGVGLWKQDGALAGVRPRQMAGTVQATGNDDARVRRKVESGDGAGIGADIEETAVAGDQYAAGVGDRRHHRLDAAGEIDLLDVAARKLCHVGHAMRLIQGNLGNAVQSAGHHAGGGPVHVGQAKAQQCAGTLRDIGMEAVGAEFNVVRCIVPAAKNSLDVSVGGHGDYVAGTGIRSVKLVGADPVGTALQISIAGSDGRRNW